MTRARSGNVCIKMAFLAIITTLAAAAANSTEPRFELHYNVSNMGEQIADPGNTARAQWVVLLSPATSDLADCGRKCLEYSGNSSAAPLHQCQSFTRYVAAVGNAKVGDCYGHLDPIWLPLNGVNGSSEATLADSGVVLRPCTTAFDCSFNGVCAAGGVCACTQGWTGHRCQTLDLLPVDRSKYGFSPQDEAGQNLSSWGGSVLSEQGVWHSTCPGRGLVFKPKCVC
jgi:hypothetical protein